jgi:opacity protein-like surface antigen
MKVLASAAAILFLTGEMASVRAQEPNGHKLVRGDVTGSVGWLHVNKEELGTYDDWHSRALFGSVGVGIYWTDHVKTELQVGANDRFTVYAPARFEIAGQPFGSSSEYEFAARRLSLTGQYQFGRNQWFHPFLGAGIEVLAERTSRRDAAVYSFDQVTRQSRIVRDAVAHPDRTDVRTLALVTTGFKAYVHPRAFFLTDGRVSFDSRINEVLLRFGLGIDF